MPKHGGIASKILVYNATIGNALTQNGTWGRVNPIQGA
jgi:hypothetical protein